MSILTHKEKHVIILEGGDNARRQEAVEDIKDILKELCIAKTLTDVKEETGLDIRDVTGAVIKTVVSMFNERTIKPQVLIVDGFEPIKDMDSFISKLSQSLTEAEIDRLSITLGMFNSTPIDGEINQTYLDLTTKLEKGYESSELIRVVNITDVHIEAPWFTQIFTSGIFGNAIDEPFLVRLKGNDTYCSGLIIKALNSHNIIHHRYDEDNRLDGRYDKFEDAYNMQQIIDDYIEGYTRGGYMLILNGFDEGCSVGCSRSDDVDEIPRELNKHILYQTRLAEERLEELKSKKDK